jgi:hypothetical protein
MIENQLIPLLEKNFKSSVIKFSKDKEDAIGCIDASIRTTLIVSG